VTALVVIARPLLPYALSFAAGAMICGAGSCWGSR
jgi:zinc transporter ZupT